jgi:TetR/AcrR family transcriptional regulator
VSAAREFRAAQTRAVEALLPIDASNAGVPSAGGIVMIAASLARMLVSETALGLTEGHAEALLIVEEMLTRLKPR